jgi:poly(3-hydroxybutyrate) depolymerase
MKVWWDGLKVEKYDITDIGHTWGTGLLNYYQDGNIQIIK